MVRPTPTLLSFVCSCDPFWRLVAGTGLHRIPIYRCASDLDLGRTCIGDIFATWHWISRPNRVGETMQHPTITALLGSIPRWLCAVFRDIISYFVMFYLNVSLGFRPRHTSMISSTVVTWLTDAQIRILTSGNHVTYIYISCIFVTDRPVPPRGVWTMHGSGWNVCSNEAMCWHAGSILATQAPRINLEIEYRVEKTHLRH